MTAWKLLRAMSELPPEMLDAALNAGTQDSGSEHHTAPVTQDSGRGTVSLRSAGTASSEHNRFIRISMILASAACMVLMLGVMLHFRHNPQDDNGIVMMSDVSDHINEITGTEPPQTTVPAPSTQPTAALTTQTTAVTAEQTDSSRETSDSAAAVTQEMITEPVTVTETEAVTSAETETTTAAVTYAENVPVLLAMGDGKGTMETDITWELVTEQAEITAYLSGDTPVVTVGEGQKSADVSAAIMENCSMLRIRFAAEDGIWSSYGITGAELDSSGVLHLSIAVYEDGIPMYAPEEGPQAWVYETAMLFEKGSLPDITDVTTELTFYDGTDNITQWLSYTEDLLNDIYIHVS